MVKISDTNVDSWVNRLPFTDQIKGDVDVAAVNKALGLQVGDVVILNTRPAFLSVCCNNDNYVRRVDIFTLYSTLLFYPTSYLLILTRC